MENSDLAQNTTKPQFSKYYRPGRRQVNQNLINCKPIKFLTKAPKQNTKHLNLWILETIRYNTHLRKLNLHDLNHNETVYYMHISFWIKWNRHNLPWWRQFLLAWRHSRTKRCISSTIKHSTKKIYMYIHLNVNILFPIQSVLITFR